MSITRFRRESNIAIRIYGGMAMNKVDLIGEENKLDADKKRIAWLREQGHLKGKSK